MKHTRLFAFTLLIMILLAGCNKDEPMWFDKDYVFLEQHFSEYSEFIKGDFCPHLCIDFPTYEYNPYAKSIVSYSDFDMNKKTIMALGMGMSASGVASSGAGTGLYEVHELPYETNSLTVNSIDEDGKAHFNYKDSFFVLSPNEEWLIISTKLDTLIWENLDPETYLEYTDTTIIKYTYTDRITNWGILEKENFTMFSSD